MVAALKDQGISSGLIHEACQIRDPEERDPGIVRRTDDTLRRRQVAAKPQTSDRAIAAEIGVHNATIAEEGR